jgi:DNA-binding transcriptional MerR regulator
MKMRELESRTGVDREVIRIYFRKGLLPEPHRPTRNAADYGEAHVRAVTAVRELQRKSRLTLDQIKAALEGAGLEGGSTAAYQHLEALLSVRFGLDESPVVDLEALKVRNPRAEHDAHVFAAMGMITLIEAEAGVQLSLNDARLVEIWGAIRETGFTEETGFPPENIGFYLKAAETVGAMEAKVFREGSQGQIGEEAAANMLHVALPLMLDFFGLLRLKAFMREISKPANADPVPRRRRPRSAPTGVRLRGTDEDRGG